MKKMKLFLFLLVLQVVFLCGCQGAASDESLTDKTDLGETVQGTAEIKDEATVPQIDKIKMICELATLECRYHFFVCF